MIPKNTLQTTKPWYCEIDLPPSEAKFKATVSLNPLDGLFPARIGCYRQ